MTRPLLPENLDDLDEIQRSRETKLYHRRLVHYHYVKNTEEYNEIHSTALADSMGVLRRRLFDHASDPWESETLALKVALTEAMKNWEILTGEGPPCPFVFDAEDGRKTMKLDAEQSEADESLEAYKNMICFGPEGWVPSEHHEEAMTRSKWLKECALALAEAESGRTGSDRGALALGQHGRKGIHTCNELGWIFCGVVSYLLYLWPVSPPQEPPLFN